MARFLFDASFRNGELRATPDSSLLVLVACGDGEHDVVLHPDWSVTTPHDLEAERILRALGGSSDCVALVDAVVPAAREWLSRQLRHSLPRLRRIGPDLWATIDLTGCCERFRRTGQPLAEAAEHARSVQHIANKNQVGTRQLTRLTRAIGKAHGFREAHHPHSSALEAAEACVQPKGAAMQLWEAGIPPELVLRVHAELSLPGLALPARFYQQLLVGQIDTDWITRTVTAANIRPGEQLLCWLVETYTSLDQQLPPARAAWLATKLPPRLIHSLSAAGYQAQDVQVLADAASQTRLGAASILEHWVRAGCRPSIDQILALQVHGPGIYPTVSSAALERLLVLLGGTPHGITRTQLGLLLQAAGSVPAAETWIKAGISDAVSIARGIADGQVPKLPTTEGHT